MNWYLKVVRNNYINFTGRARRQEYWMFAFINLIIIVILNMIDTQLFGQNMPIFTVVYSLAILLPGVGVSVRRLHDTNRSGWWALLALIPIIGAIILIVMLSVDSTFGSNRFGYNPKHMGNEP